VFRRNDRKGPFELIELAPGITEAQVRQRTSAQYRAALG
jgi:hypothetical protein